MGGPSSEFSDWRTKPSPSSSQIWQPEGEVFAAAAAAGAAAAMQVRAGVGAVDR